MRFVVIGLGSMGKRRIRCLKSLGYNNIGGYDIREDRRDEAKGLYDIDTFSSIEDIDFSNIDALIISTPPDRHIEYMRLAVEHRVPAFVEASVVLEGLEQVERMASESGVLIAPSCTLKFHPAIQDIKELVQSGKYGRVTNFSYHSGQYLPDWHPWEDVKDFYVSNPETGGCREIVPFELTWLVDVVGWPEQTLAFYGRTAYVGADIDDTYTIVLKYPQHLGSLTVDVVARNAIRSLILNLERAQILWNWEEGVVKLYEADSARWIYYHQPEGNSAEGYNKNIIEDMYISEISSFINAVLGRGEFPNTLKEDIMILTLLEKIEGKR